MYSANVGIAWGERRPRQRTQGMDRDRLPRRPTTIRGKPPRIVVGLPIGLIAIACRTSALLRAML